MVASSPCDAAAGENIRKWVLYPLPGVALAVHLCFFSSWDTLILVLMALICLSCARWMQECWLAWPALQQVRSDTGGASGESKKMHMLVGICLVVLFVLLLVDDDGSASKLISRHLSLVVMAVFLAVALECGKTPSAILTGALRQTQTLNSEGAAWSYYLGYLDKIFGPNGKTIQERMEDYKATEDLGADPFTNMKSMIILLPMKCEAMLSDTDFSHNDSTIKKEKVLQQSYQEGGRPFGQSQVYTIEYEGQRYRAVMEMAMPLRVAMKMVNDSEIRFTKDDFGQFALTFKKALSDILRKNPEVEEQLRLVSVNDSRIVGRTVVEKLKSSFSSCEPETNP